jgi:hypothetical protein
MADIFQGAPLPTITTTEQQQTTLPDFYTNYLQDVANLGTNAVQQGGVAGFGPLQQQAFQMAPNAAFSGAQTAGAGANLLGAAGTTGAPDIVGSYMNPYTSNVVNEMARLQQQNLQRNVMPTIAGGGVGTGSFGSRRQQQAMGQTLADMQANLTGQQYQALNAGYGDAMKNAQTDLNRQMQAGQGLGNLATQQYNIGSGGLKQLSDLGQLQQTQGQRALDYPMIQAQNFAKLMQGYSMPTGTAIQKVGPGSSGQYSASPLGQISGLLTGIGSFMNSGSGTSGTSSTGTSGQNVVNGLLNLPADLLGQVRNALGSLGINFAEGGGVNGYADGGTVEPTEIQGMTKPYYLTQDESQPQPVDLDSIMFENNPADPIMYTGGTPNFDETTGTYIDPGVKPYLPPMADEFTPVAMPTDIPVRNTNTPLPYERTNSVVTTQPTPKQSGLSLMNNARKQIEQQKQQQRQLIQQQQQQKQQQRQQIQQQIQQQKQLMRSGQITRPQFKNVKQTLRAGYADGGRAITPLPAAFAQRINQIKGRG